MKNIVRLSEETALNLAVAITGADARGGSVRISTYTDTHGDTFIMWDAGAGWTAPEKGVSL